MLVGNRGEWSEVYAFLRILADGELKSADAGLNGAGILGSAG